MTAQQSVDVRTVADIVPENLEQVLMNSGHVISEQYWLIGQTANLIFEIASKLGFTRREVAIYVGGVVGKGSSSILRYMRTAEFFQDDDWEEYPTLSFSHFACAVDFGSKATEVLEWAANSSAWGKPASVDAMIDYAESGGQISTGPATADEIETAKLESSLLFLISELKGMTQRLATLYTRLGPVKQSKLKQVINLLSEISSGPLDE